MTVICDRTRLGNYYLGKLLGAGNYAIVRLAEHCITGTKVAVKIIDKTKLSEADKPRLFREVQIMKLLEHPYIIQLYQVLETPRYIHLISKYAENGELFEHVMEYGKLKEADARRYFIQICKAMRYCHNKGIVHRDLKIENVLLDSNNNVKIADFGFSNYYKSQELLNTYCGSPQYAAPEIFSGESYDGTKSDIWSMGIILYVLVTGGCPFDGETEMEVRRSVLNGKFRVPYYVSYECESLIRGMLTMDPKKRFSMSKIFTHKWLQSDQTGCQQDLMMDDVEDKSKKLNDNILNLMHNIGISKSKVLQSYNAYLFNDFTAIYKLLSDQLSSNGNINAVPIKAWLKKEFRKTEGEATSAPMLDDKTCSSVKKCPSRTGIDKVLHQAKSRALSAIFSKSGGGGSVATPGGDEVVKSRAKHKDLRISQASPSPLVSSLISPRSVISNDTHKFTLFTFCQNKKLPKSEQLRSMSQSRPLDM